MTTSSYRFLTGVLNQLAGTTGCGAPGAANKYAGSTGLGVVGALNYKNGWRSGGTKPYLGLWAVCNALAGTVGHGPVEALNVLAGNTNVNSIAYTIVDEWDAYSLAAAPPAAIIVTLGEVEDLVSLSFVGQSSGTDSIASVTCPNTDTWVQDHVQAASSGNYGRREFWHAKVKTPGLTTITITYTGGDITHNYAVAVVEVNASLSHEGWIVGNVGDSNTNAGNLGYPSLTSQPTTPGGVYVGIASSLGTLTATSELAGFTYYEVASTSGRWAVAGVLPASNTAYAPTQGNSGGNGYASGVIYYAQ